MSNEYEEVQYAGKTQKELLEAIVDILKNGESAEHHGIRINTLMAHCYPYFDKEGQS